MQNALPPGKHSSTLDRIYRKDDELRKVHAEELMGEIKKAAGSGVKAVVITGGEPLLHLKPLGRLVSALLSRGFSIEFETNGTLSAGNLPASVRFNVSPKLANSFQPQSLRINMATLSEFKGRDSIFKFVVDCPTDLAEVIDLTQALEVSPSRVYLMPQGKTEDELMSRAPWVVDKCLKHGFRFSHRLHVSIWGDKRGV